MKNTECGLLFFILFKLLLIINFGVKLSCGTGLVIPAEEKKEFLALTKAIDDETFSTTQHMRYLELINKWLNAVQSFEEFKYDFSFNLIMCDFQ